MARTSDAQNIAHMTLAGSAEDGWSDDKEATATCYCGAVQIAFVSLCLSTLLTEDID
jgi:hypothetical protein